MNVYLNRVDSNTDWGLCLVAANSLEEAIESFHNSKLVNEHTIYLDEYGDKFEYQVDEYIIPDNEVFSNDNWKLAKGVNANVNEATVIECEYHAK